MNYDYIVDTIKLILKTTGIWIYVVLQNYYFLQYYNGVTCHMRVSICRMQASVFWNKL